MTNTTESKAPDAAAAAGETGAAAGPATGAAAAEPVPAATTAATAEAPKAEAAEAAKDAPPTAGTSAAAAASAAGAAVQHAASEAQHAAQAAIGRAQQHGFYQGNFEEEVGQVVKSLGSFWGGLKARSASTLTSIKGDLDKTYAQVQNDFKNLQDTKVEVGVKEPEEWEAEQEEERKKKAEKAELEAAEAATREKGKARAEPVDGEDATGPTPSSPTTAFFSRITSSTSQLQNTLQATFASTVAAAKSNPALNNPTQLRAQLAENLRLSSARENLTLSFRQAEALAEDYLKKGEGFLRDAEKAAEKWVEDNVKIVPPEGTTGYVSMGGWDAGDLYVFSTTAATPPPEATTTVSGADGGRTPRASLSSAAIAGSRKEALLRRLREDKELLLHDPADEAETPQRRAEFAAWIKDVWPSAQTSGRLDESGNVGAIRMALVPEHLTDDQFWQRYLFHKDMIEAADSKRKALLAATAQEEAADEFNWDDDEDEPAATAGTTPKTVESAAPMAAPGEPKAQEAAAPDPVPTAEAKKTPVAASSAAGASAGASAGTSPRDSEESYDVVRTSTAAPTEEDSDSDWE